MIISDRTLLSTFLPLGHPLDDRIDPLPLLIGISPLALIGDDKEKLIFAMEVCDVNGTGFLRVMEVFKIFQSK